jgi:hypothetical protein
MRAEQTMSNYSDEAMALFEMRPDDQGRRGGQDDLVGHVYGEDPPFVPVRRRNPLAMVGAVLSFIPLVGLVLSAVGFVRSRTRGGVGRTVALVGLALSVIFGGAETYVGTTAPLFDAGCVDATSSVSRLQAIQASPGGNATVLANEMNSIHADLATAAGQAETAQVRTRLLSVADDVKMIGGDLTAMQQSGDTSRLLGDESKLQTDGAAAQSYCDSL